MTYRHTADALHAVLTRHACPAPQPASLVHAVAGRQLPHESHTAPPATSLWHALKPVLLSGLQPLYVSGSAHTPLLKGCRSTPHVVPVVVVPLVLPVVVPVGLAALEVAVVETTAVAKVDAKVEAPLLALPLNVASLLGAGAVLKDAAWLLLTLLNELMAAEM